MLPHLVVVRPGLWWQTTGDEEESSALQFRTVPTEHLRLTTHESLRVCVQCILVGRTVCVLVGWLNCLLWLELECIFT